MHLILVFNFSEEAFSTPSIVEFHLFYLLAFKALLYFHPHLKG